MKRLACMAIGLVCASVLAGEMRKREFPLGTSWVLSLGMADSWKETVPDPGALATISIASKTPGRFVLLLTPIPVSGPPKSHDDIRDFVQGAARRMGPQSVEKTLAITSLKGPQASGCYFRATDPAPKPGEYRFLYQGAMTAGPALASITVLYNEGGKAMPRRRSARSRACASRRKASRGSRPLRPESKRGVS